LRSLSPKSQIIYLEGNHELRLEKAITENLKAAHGLVPGNRVDSYPVLSIPYLLGLDDLKIQYVGKYPDSIHWVNSKFACVHGTTVKSGGGETVKVLLKDKPYSLCQGHIHRLEFKALTVHNHLGRETRYAFSPGTIAILCGAVPAHSKHNDWQQGLSVVHYDDQDIAVEMIVIDEGSLIYQGQKLVSTIE
jgi:hypothetical protein